MYPTAPPDEVSEPWRGRDRRDQYPAPDASSGLQGGLAYGVGVLWVRERWGFEGGEGGEIEKRDCKKYL